MNPQRVQGEAYAVDGDVLVILDSKKGGGVRLNSGFRFLQSLKAIHYATHDKKTISN